MALKRLGLSVGTEPFEKLRTGVPNHIIELFRRLLKQRGDFSFGSGQIDLRSIKAEQGFDMIVASPRD